MEDMKKEMPKIVKMTEAKDAAIQKQQIENEIAHMKANNVYSIGLIETVMQRKIEIIKLVKNRINVQVTVKPVHHLFIKRRAKISIVDSDLLKKDIVDLYKDDDVWMELTDEIYSIVEAAINSVENIVVSLFTFRKPRTTNTLMELSIDAVDSVTDGMPDDVLVVSDIIEELNNDIRNAVPRDDIIELIDKYLF